MTASALTATELEGTGKPQEVRPCARNQFSIDLVAGEPVECVVVTNYPCFS